MLNYDAATKQLCNLLHAFCERNYLYINLSNELTPGIPKHRILFLVGSQECYPDVDWFIIKSREYFADYKLYGHAPTLNHRYECLIMVDYEVARRRVENGVDVDVYTDIYLPIKTRLCNQFCIKEDEYMTMNTFYEELLMREPAYKEKVDYTKNFKPFVYSRYPEIDRVIYNDPATIVFWKDGTKTVVKAQDCKFDPAVGLAMCFVKKTIGLKEFFKHLPEETEEDP